MIGSNFRAWLVDLDGTLYANKPVRLAMAFWTLFGGLVWGVTPFAAERASLVDGYHPIRYGQCFLNLCVVSLALVAHDVAQSAGHLVRRGKACFPGSPPDSRRSGPGPPRPEFPAAPMLYCGPDRGAVARGRPPPALC